MCTEHISHIELFHGIFVAEDHFFRYKIKKGLVAMKRRELTPEQRERQRIYAHKYYLKHREEILAHNREYYQRKGRAWNAERARKYRHANHEAYLAKRREYRANHKEHFRQSAKEHRQKYCQSYFQRHCVSISQKTIGEYCYRAIERVQQECPEKVERLLEQYPFEGSALKCLRKQLRRLHIYPSQARYDDCYDAGMMAYLYTIHRCAYMGYSHVEAYMAKMIRIYLLCAAIAFRDTQNLCRENNLQELNLDQFPYGQV